MSKNDRLFNVTDSTILQHGKTVAVTLPQDVGDFITFDSTMNDSYPSTIDEAVNAVIALKTDMVVIDEMAEKTLAVNDALAACNKSFRTIKFFVLKAFPDNKAIQNQFGFNDIRKLRKDQSRMVMFMSDFIQIVAKHGDALIAEGCSVAVLDELPVMLQNLQNTNTAQEMFKKERGLITQGRIEKLNELYSLLKPISEVAQIIYADDVARLARYVMPLPKSSSNSEDDLIVS